MKLSIERRTRPRRTDVRTAGDTWLATFTEGAYTVRTAGPGRTFSEATAADPVRHATWVRALPAPFAGGVDRAWLTRALRANRARAPDVLAISVQYLAGQASIVEDGLQIAGDADYGPLKDGQREEGSDFNDYLGIEWAYPETIDRPERRQRHCLDCSGFMRMVWGYRRHLPGGRRRDTIPLCVKPRRSRDAIPRRAFEIHAAGPGVLIVPDGGVQVTDFSALDVGDLVFFDADPDDGPRLDHIGMYLGPDAAGHHRFISSRKGANGPTLGDYRGKSILDGTGLYARAFRAVRRL